MYILGMDCFHFGDAKKVKAFVADVTHHLDAVIFVERWDESMVYLKNLLCLTWSEIMGLESHKNLERQTISPASRKILKDLLLPEYILYNHLFAFQQKQFEAYGLEKLKREVATLVSFRKKAFKRCNITSISWHSKRGVLQRRAVANVDSEECRQIDQRPKKLPSKVFQRRRNKLGKINF